MLLLTLKSSSILLGAYMRAVTKSWWWRNKCIYIANTFLYFSLKSNYCCLFFFFFSKIHALNETIWKKGHHNSQPGNFIFLIFISSVFQYFNFHWIKRKRKKKIVILYDLTLYSWNGQTPRKVLEWDKIIIKYSVW